MKATFWLDESKRDHISHLGKIMKIENNLIQIQVEYDEYTIGVLLTSIFHAGVMYGLDKYLAKPFDKSKP